MTPYKTRHPIMVPDHAEPNLLLDRSGLQRCPYCGQPGTGWRAEDLSRGQRSGTGYVQYHCYEAKVMD